MAVGEKERRLETCAREKEKEKASHIGIIFKRCYLLALLSPRSHPSAVNT